jgi:hypothetical protein
LLAFIFFLDYSIDNVYSSFDLDKNTGILCKKVNDGELKSRIIKSPLGFLDPFDNQCYNLLFFASVYNLTESEIASQVKYDPSNCSFNYFKICVNDCGCESLPPKYKKPQYCQAVLSLDNFSPFKTQCLYKFRLENRLFNKNQFDYRVNAINNLLDPSIFFVNKTIDCLSIKTLTDININLLIGLHYMNISVQDQYGRHDWIECSIFITHTCLEKTYVKAELDVHTVYRNVENYTRWHSLLT